MNKKEYLEWKNIQPCKSEREQIMRAEKFIKREAMKSNEIVKKAGGIYKGIQKGMKGENYVLFHNPRTDSSHALEEENLTEEKVRKKLLEGDKAFKEGETQNLIEKEIQTFFAEILENFTPIEKRALKNKIVLTICRIIREEKEKEKENMTMEGDKYV